MNLRSDYIILKCTYTCSLTSSTLISALHSSCMHTEDDGVSRRTGDLIWTPGGRAATDYSCRSQSQYLGLSAILTSIDPVSRLGPRQTGASIWIDPGQTSFIHQLSRTPPLTLTPLCKFSQLSQTDCSEYSPSELLGTRPTQTDASLWRTRTCMCVIADHGYGRRVHITQVSDNYACPAVVPFADVMLHVILATSQDSL